MVTSRLKVGDEAFDPRGDYNLSVTRNLNGHDTDSWILPDTDRSTSYSPNLKVLRNGDAIP